MMKVGPFATHPSNGPAYAPAVQRADVFANSPHRLPPQPPGLPGVANTPCVWLHSDLPLPSTLEGKLQRSGAVSRVTVYVRGKAVEQPVQGQAGVGSCTLRLVRRSGDGRAWCYAVQPPVVQNPSCMGTVVAQKDVPYLAWNGGLLVPLLGDGAVAAGQTVVAQWLDVAHPEAGARWVATLPPGNDRTARICATALAQGARAGFPAAVLAAAAGVKPLDPPDLLDLTGVPFVSLDPLVSKVCDQAFYIEKHPKGDGFIVHYAIADAIAWIPADGAVDQEARQRGATVFLPCTLPAELGPGFPMVPHAVAHDGASLKADRPCLAWVVSVHLNVTGEPCAYSVVHGTMRNRAEITYEQCMALMEPATLAELCSSEPFGTSLALLPEVAALCEKRQVQRGARPATGQSIVAVWNQQLSLIANEAVADFLRYHGVRAPYATGRSTWAAAVAPHGAMKLPAYVHATAPLRRYEDLVTQRIVAALVDHSPVPYQDETAIDDVIEVCAAAHQRQRAIDAQLCAAPRSFSKVSR